MSRKIGLSECSFLYRCTTTFHRGLFSRATKLFPSLDDVLEFMEDYGFDVARATLLESSGRFSEAAELHLEEGRPLQAIQLFMRDWEDSSSRQRAEECVLHGLWQHLSFAVLPKGGYERSDLGRLLRAAGDIKARAGTSISKHTLDQVLVFVLSLMKPFPYLCLPS